MSKRPWKREKGYRTKEYRKNIKLKTCYGITLDQYNILLESQSGKCAICRQNSIDETLSVDHNHITGKVRGLLCKKCNTSLGYLKENIEIMEAMIFYLRQHN